MNTGKSDALKPKPKGSFNRMKYLTLFLLAVLVSGCSGPKRISGPRFQQHYGSITEAQTMHAVSYLGQRDGRAFIRVESMSTVNRKKWSDRVLYAEIAELDPSFRDSLPKLDFSGRP
jgi:hypothetical protein